MKSRSEQERLRVLLVEDDAESGEALKMMLERRGVAVTLLPGADEAIEAFDPEAFDAIVSDIRLVGRSGVDILRHVREKLPDFPVILLTGYDSIQSAIDAVRLGAQDYILKPLGSIEDLLGPVEKAVLQHRLLVENRALEQRLKMRNQELRDALSELRRAQSELVHHERLSALGSMAAKVVHEFRNILIPIVGGTELLLPDLEALGAQEDVMATAQSMRQAALDAQRIVSRLRAFHRPLGGDGHSITDLRDVVVQAIDFVRPKWEQGCQSDTIVVETQFGDAPRILGDQTELREVFVNLIANSADAMPDGGVIRVTVSEEEGKVVAEVLDDGTGMTEDVRARCFEPFFTTKGREGGTGLGLAGVHGIVQRHDGAIEVESAPGKGTRVTVKFPGAAEYPPTSLFLKAAEERCTDTGHTER